MGELAAQFHELGTPAPTAADIAWHVSRLPADAGALLVADGDGGRLLIALAQHDLHVHGIDGSAFAVARLEARLRAAGRTTPVYRQDLDGLNLPFRYAGAAIGARAWQGFARQRLEEALARLRAHLLAPGVLLLECTVPGLAEHPPGAPIVEIERVKLDDGSIITRRCEQRVDANSQRIDSSERYELRRGARVLAREDVTASIGWHGPDTMLELVRKAGWEARVEDLADSPRGHRFAIVASL